MPKIRGFYSRGVSIQEVLLYREITPTTRDVHSDEVSNKSERVNEYGRVDCNSKECRNLG